MPSMIDQAIAPIAVSDFATLGVLGQVCVPYRKVGVDYSKRETIDALDEAWERPATMATVQAYLTDHGLDVEANGLLFACIVPTQRLGDNMKPRMVNTTIVGVQATVMGFYAFLHESAGKKGTIQPRKMNLTWWFDEPNEPPTLCDDRLKLVHLSDDDLVPCKALWAESAPVVRTLIRRHGG